MITDVEGNFTFSTSQRVSSANSCRTRTVTGGSPTWRRLSAYIFTATRNGAKKNQRKCRTPTLEEYWTSKRPIVRLGSRSTSGLWLIMIYYKVSSRVPRVEVVDSRHCRRATAFVGFGRPWKYVARSGANARSKAFTNDALRGKTKITTRVNRSDWAKQEQITAEEK